MAEIECAWIDPKSAPRTGAKGLHVEWTGGDIAENDSVIWSLIGYCNGRQLKCEITSRVSERLGPNDQDWEAAVQSVIGVFCEEHADDDSELNIRKSLEKQPWTRQ